MMGIRGLLLDVDGTLLEADRAVPGAPEALASLRKAGLTIRLTTNTTRRPRSAVGDALRAEGFQVADDEILTPALLARRRILESGRIRAALLVADGTRADLEGVEENPDRPDWVVVGDLGTGFTYERLDEAFGRISRGARLIALQKNRAWKPDGKTLHLDAGPFVAALEYAAGVEAEVMGKPSPSFYALALGELALPASLVLTVGDDCETDGLGGDRAGCRTAIVRTGKFSDEGLERSGLSPDLLLDSVASLPGKLLEDGS